MIKIAPATLKIEHSFKDAMLKLYTDYLLDIDRKSGGDPERRTYLLSDRPDVSRRALDAVKGVSDTRRGLVYEYTCFKVANEYTRLYATRYNDVTWLMGDTKPVTIRGGQRPLQVGPYTVAFPLDGLIKMAVSEQHFIPIASPLAMVRHPHHYATPTDDSNVSHNPLDMHESTCWGDFGTGIRYAIAERDMPGLFSMMYKYLSRYNPHSVLGGYDHHIERSNGC